MKKVISVLLALLMLVGCQANEFTGIDHPDTSTIDSDTMYYVVELTREHIVLGPSDYRPDTKMYYPLIDMKTASQISYYDTTLNVTTDENGKTVEQLIPVLGTIETIEEAMEVGCPYVYVDCNENNEIIEVILIGELAFKV